MRKLPPLPSSVYGATGPIPVEYVPDLKASDGEEVIGLWLPWLRTIKIRSNVPREVQWVTLKHEWLHSVFWYAGTKMPEDVEERVCDAAATAMIAEMLGR